MMSKKLQQAREFETKYLPYVGDEQPLFHMTGGIGWINDPNGFAPYQKEYHLFFQYYPYDTKWGPMHWGHVKTTDFIRWERLPAALAPDEEYDRDGCFSGGAVELKDGRHLLMYTGVRNDRRQDGKVESFQTQCVAIGDGVDYEKQPFNPVIDASFLPEGCSPNDFRDPKVWYQDDRYYAVIGNRPADGSGHILLFVSEDALSWKFLSVLTANHDCYGKMWECPDFFHLDGKDVVLTSPQEMHAVGLEFHPGNGTLCLIGTFDRETNHLTREGVQAIDYGLDFYAAQTLAALDGRRIMIAWMQNWETSGCRLKELPYLGQMIIPRELSVKKGRLIQNPVRELEKYRGFRIVYSDVLVRGDTDLAGVKGRFLDMTLTLRPGNDNELYKWFRLYLAKDGQHYTYIRYKPETGTIRVDRTHSGFPHDIVNIREFPVFSHSGVIKMRVILDRYSLELFVNDGEQAASFTIYTPVAAEGISFASDGAVKIDIEKYDLVIKD